MRIQSVKSLAALLALLSSSACQTTLPDDSDAIARALVGLWQYDYGEEDCPGNAIMGFRADGKVTSTSGDCQLDSDGFGEYTYGWYVADGAICTFEIEEEFADRAAGRSRPKLYRRLYLAKVKEGFVGERCDWKVLKFSRREIVFDPGGERPLITMKRYRD